MAGQNGGNFGQQGDCRIYAVIGSDFGQSGQRQQQRVQFPIGQVQRGKGGQRLRLVPVAPRALNRNAGRGQPVHIAIDGAFRYAEFARQIGCGLHLTAAQPL